MKLTLKRPDDWHLHLRDGDTLAAVVPHSARQFGRAMVMPNLRPPVTTTDAAAAYRARILAAVPAGCDFTPWMTLYLTDHTTPAEITAAANSGVVLALKLYPAGATTNSAAGVTDFSRLDPVLEAMAIAGLPLLVHGEATAPEVDVFDREAVFIAQVLQPLHARHPDLRLVLEHITTQEGVDFVRQAGPGVAGTITAHHLLWNRSALFTGGLNPHAYCLPVLKREAHRQALLEAATSGESCFFLGTDSAPHNRQTKETACGCAGIYTAATALELYATAFDASGHLDRLEGFASVFGAEFYGLPVATDTITLERVEWRLPDAYPLGPQQVVVPMWAGQKLSWRVSLPTTRKKILFLCTGNSCRSQMAEGWTRALHPTEFAASSAGTTTHGLNSAAVQVMAEAGVDISGQQSQPLDDFKHDNFDYVITVCDNAHNACPVFPGKTQVIHHNFDDPPALAHAADDLAPYRRVRDEIRQFIATLPSLLKTGDSAP